MVFGMIFKNDGSFYALTIESGDVAYIRKVCVIQAGFSKGYYNIYKESRPPMNWGVKQWMDYCAKLTPMETSRAAAAAAPAPVVALPFVITAVAAPAPVVAAPAPTPMLTAEEKIWKELKEAGESKNMSTMKTILRKILFWGL